MKARIFYSVLVVLLYLSSCSTTKNTIETVQQITQKVESKDFTIKVNYALPMRMKQIALTSGYDLKIKNDSAFAFLPYYGVAHVAPMNPSEGGIKFNEKLTDYNIRQNKKKDGWEINFKVINNEHHYQIYLNIFNTGSSTITINSYERDAITFYGNID